MHASLHGALSSENSRYGMLYDAWLTIRICDFVLVNFLEAGNHMAASSLIMLKLRMIQAVWTIIVSASLSIKAHMLHMICKAVPFQAHQCLGS